MKSLKIFILGCLIILLFGIDIFGSTKDDLQAAEEAAKAGYITASELEIFKSERDIDLLKKPYGDMPLRAAYALIVYDLFPDSDQPYNLDKEFNIAEAIRFAMHIRESVKTIEKGNYNHPFKNVPAEYDKYIGYAYKNKLIPDRLVNEFNPEAPITYEEYEIIMLKLLGYVEGTDFTEENLKELTRSKGFGPVPPGNKAFIKSMAVEMANFTLSRSTKGSHTTYRNHLISKKLISKKAEKFLSEQGYKRYTYAKRDNFSEVYWKYQREYEFVHFLDCRNGPAPIHPGISWPDKNVSLEYAGYIKIMLDGLDETFTNKLLENMLADFKVDSGKIERIMKKFKSEEKADHIDYYSRMIDIKKKRNVISIDLYL